MLVLAHGSAASHTGSTPPAVGHTPSQRLPQSRVCSAATRPLDALLQRAFANGTCLQRDVQLDGLWAPMMAAAAFALAFPDMATAATDALDGQHAHTANVVATVGEVEFWANMTRYVKFTITVAVGMVYTVFKPLVDLASKNPLAFVSVVGGLGGSVWLVKFVLNAMVGLDPDIVFQPASPLISQ